MSAPLVTVRGSAQLEGPPDLAAISFTVHSAASTAEGARSELFQATAVVQALVEEFGSAIERSALTGLHIAPVFDKKSSAKITGYRGSCTTELVIHDFASLAPIVLALTPMTTGELNGPWWSLRPDNPLHRAVRIAAIADARTRADDYAGAFGGQVVDLVEVSDLEGGFTGGRERAARSFAMSAADEPAFEFEPPTQVVSGQVTVRFTMTTPDLAPASTGANRGT
jgi:uncharacterized protein YggE